MRMLLHFIVTALALYVIVKFVPPGGYTFTTWGVLWGAFIFGIVNTLIGPILRLIALPLTILTFGVFSFIVNWGLFALTVWITPGLKLTPGGPWPGWITTFVGSIVMMIISTIVADMSSPKRPASA